MGEGKWGFCSIKQREKVKVRNSLSFAFEEFYYDKF
jgi:hypothetical protein